MEGDSDKSDQAELLKHPLFMMDGAFSVRLLVLPTRTGKILTWMVAAPVDVDMLAIRAALARADVDSTVIPTTAVKLALGKQLMEREGVFLPAEDRKDSATTHEWGIIRCYRYTKLVKWEL